MQTLFTLTNSFCILFSFCTLGWHPRSSPNAPNIGGEGEHGSHSYPSSQVLASRNSGRVAVSERCAAVPLSTPGQQSAPSTSNAHLNSLRTSSVVERETIGRGRGDKMTEASSNGSKKAPPTSEQQRTQNTHSSSRKGTTAPSSTATLLNTSNGEYPNEDIFIEENYEKIEVSCPFIII